MKIDRYELVKNNIYNVYLSNGEVLTLDENVITDNELLLKKEIDTTLYNKLKSDNDIISLCNMAIKYISIRLRSIKEVRDYLSKKCDNSYYIDMAIDKLIGYKYLDDDRFTKAFINDKINLSNDGPFKIKKLLLELDFNESDIDNYLNNFDNSLWEEKLIKIVNKKKNLMNNKSYYMFITKLKSYLFNLGYDKYMIDNILSNIKYESNALEKDFNSALKKYKDDKNKLINYLLRKGYSYDEINTKLKNLV